MARIMARMINATIQPGCPAKNIKAATTIETALDDSPARLNSPLDFILVYLQINKQTEGYKPFALNLNLQSQGSFHTLGNLIGGFIGPSLATATHSPLHSIGQASKGCASTEQVSSETPYNSHPSNHEERLSDKYEYTKED